MRYIVSGRQLASLDEDCARFVQRRQLVGCPPGKMRGPVLVLVAFGILPWIQRVNPAPGESVAPTAVAAAWSAVFVGLAALLFISRLRRRATFVDTARDLGAEIDVGACPGEDEPLGTANVFEVSISLRDGSATLLDACGRMMETTGPNRVEWREQTGHSLPWSDANEGDPHDTATIFLQVNEPRSEDLAGRFVLTSTRIDSSDLEDIRALLRDLSEAAYR